MIAQDICQLLEIFLKFPAGVNSPSFMVLTSKVVQRVIPATCLAKRQKQTSTSKQLKRLLKTTYEKLVV